MPAYTYIRDISITQKDLIKTTTQKIKRFEEMKTVKQKKVEKENKMLQKCNTFVIKT